MLFSLVLRHSAPTGPPHCVTLHTDASCWEFRGLRGGVTGCIKVPAEETWLKERLEPSCMSLWLTTTDNDGYDSALYIAVGQEDGSIQVMKGREKRGAERHSLMSTFHLDVKPLRSCNTTVRQFQRSRRILEQFLE